MIIIIMIAVVIIMKIIIIVMIILIKKTTTMMTIILNKITKIFKGESDNNDTHPPTHHPSESQAQAGCRLPGCTG